jgi:hypothetical protein
MKPRTIFRIVLIIIVIALFVRNYLLQRKVEQSRSRETVQWVDTSTFPKTKAAAQSHDLSQDDAKGGHTLKRHIGKTDAELRDRLAQERISAASTYTNRAAAESAVGATLAQNKDRIESWLKGNSHANLVLDHSSDQPVGRTLHRGDQSAQPCAHAVVVLKFDSPRDYHVLSSYPQCGTEAE